MNNTTLGSLIKEIRKNNNKTLKEFSYEIGVDISTLQKYENNIIKNIPYDKLEKILSLIDCKLSLLEIIKLTINLNSENLNSTNNFISEFKNILLFFKNNNIEQEKKDELFYKLQDEYFRNKFNNRKD